VCALAGLFCYAVAAGFLWSVTSTRFRALTGRTGFRRPERSAPRTRPAAVPRKPILDVEPVNAVLVAEEWDPGEQAAPAPTDSSEPLDALPADEGLVDDARPGKRPVRGQET